MNDSAFHGALATETLGNWAIALGAFGISAVGLALLLVLNPVLFGRGLLWVLTRTIYRVRILGRTCVPRSGPVVFVSNHVSIIDAFLLFAVQPRRVCFILVDAASTLPGIRLLLRVVRVVSIDSSAGEPVIAATLRRASAVLERGGTLCVFAETSVTKHGVQLPLCRLLAEFAEKQNAPIVPVSLDHVWGSMFRYQGRRLLWKWPQKLPYPVSVAFGEPLPPTTSAAIVRQRIQKLSADCSIARHGMRRPVHRQFVRMAARHPFRVCMIDPNNNDKIYRYISALAGARILMLKLRPLLGDDAMVGLWLPSSVGGALANVALALLRKTAVNLNYTSGADTVRSCIKQCAIRRIITARAFTQRMPIDPGPDVELIYLEDFRKDVTTFQRIRAAAAIVAIPAVLLEWVYGIHRHITDDIASIIFSSGSTGDPKGVVLTHENIAANAESINQAIDPRPSDRVLGVLPFFHSFGYTVTLWVPLQVGASMVYYADPRQAKEIGELCRRHSCTIYLSTPTFLRFCLRRCEPDDFRSLRVLICGAEKLPMTLAQEFHERFGVLPLEGYGCTELSPVAAANVPDWEFNGFRQINNRPGTIGQPVPGVAARIVNPDSFEPLPPGEEGLLLIYGANVMKGYLGKEEVTQKAIRDGWYVTGDIGRIDDDGFITLTDRLARFSKIGGEMVPHQKIEDEIHGILGTTERACVVTAVPDERKGERLVVLHMPFQGVSPHHLWQQLNGKGMPNLWVPSERDFFQVPEIPILGTGKLDLKRVKEIALAMTDNHRPKVAHS